MYISAGKSSRPIPSRIHGCLLTDKPVLHNQSTCHMCFEQLIRNGNADFSLDSVDRSTRCMGNLWQTLLRFSDHLLYHFCKKEDGSKVFLIFRVFPGPENEFELIKDYLKPALGGNIVDASCGSGMFSRLFAKR